jgi:hypothetical protein
LKLLDFFRCMMDKEMDQGLQQMIGRLLASQTEGMAARQVEAAAQGAASLKQFEEEMNAGQE